MNVVRGLTPDEAITASPLDSAARAAIHTHARTIVEGEGAEDFSWSLIEDVARAIYAAQGGKNPDLAGVVGWEDGRMVMGLMWERYTPAASAALSTIRKHQESRHVD